MWSNGLVDLYQCDARTIPLPDRSVHCVVTSPPYYGLRVYRSDDAAMIGLEPTPEGWLESMMEVFDDVWRVLRDDGVVWVNLGDSYGGSGNLLGTPWRFALAMQQRGWILRDAIIWAKASCMPESLAGTRWERCCDGCPNCTDNGGLVLRRGSWRCTNSYEHIFMLVKARGYYCDGEAVKTVATNYRPRIGGFRHGGGAYVNNHGNTSSNKPSEADSRQTGAYGTTANRRNVWRDIKPEPYGGQHFATFPTDLPRICIQASTSEAGACSECGAQWARVVEPSKLPEKYTPHYEPDSRVRGFASATPGHTNVTTTLGFRPTCTCAAATVRPLVLDPFAGTGTTLIAAMRLGRRSVGLDLSHDYLEQAVQRLSKESLPLNLA